jgi:hypothetical protein
VPDRCPDGAPRRRLATAAGGGKKKVRFARRQAFNGAGAVKADLLVPDYWRVARPRSVPEMRSRKSSRVTLPTGGKKKTPARWGT